MGVRKVKQYYYYDKKVLCKIYSNVNSLVLKSVCPVIIFKVPNPAALLLRTACPRFL